MAMTLRAIKEQLREGPYAFPGGYPKYFIAADGGTLSFAAVREQWAEVCASSIMDTRDGWRIEDVDVNWEDTTLTCDHTGRPIPSAYGEDE